MSPIATSAVVFLCVCSGATAGLVLRAALPDHHRSAESKDAVKAAMGLIGTISALVLGLLVASAKSHYDTQKEELTELSARVLLLDRVLAHYGPEANDSRALLKEISAANLDQFWGKGPLRPAPRGDVLYDRIAELSPKDDAQRMFQNQAAELIIQLGQTRTLMTAQSGQSGRSTSTPLLVIVVFWLTVNFVSFGLFASRNGTVLAALLVCALSVAGAVLLILEMDQPYEGLIRISDAPLRDVVSRLGR
jgi:hypothetical protein